MAVSRWLASLVVVSCVTAGSWIGSAQQASTQDKTAWRNGEWARHGNDPAETRYSPLDQINRSNVSRLGLAWTSVAGDGGGNQEATPLFSNGVLYAITNWSIVFALDARTGRELWRYDPNVDRAFSTPGANRGICCGVVNRGIALHDGKVLAPVIDGRMVALDGKSGALRWSTRVLPEDSTGYSITMAPRVAGNKVIVGVAGGEFTPHRGFFSAFDVDSGRELWRFYTVPGDPSKPFENKALEAAAKTWTGEWWKFGGGGSLWDGLSYDSDANLIYVGTGNGVPWPQILRGQEGYDNLYVSSILAVNPDNGELKWHYQAVPGDSWDIDTVQQLLLADIEIGGRPRKVLMQASKGGFFYVLDRITGEFLSATPFAPLNWASGHDAAGRPRINREAYYTTTQPAVISPASGGAANWAAKGIQPEHATRIYAGQWVQQPNLCRDPLRPDSRTVRSEQWHSARWTNAVAGDSRPGDSTVYRSAAEPHRRVPCRVRSGHSNGTLARRRWRRFGWWRAGDGQQPRISDRQRRTPSRAGCRRRHGAVGSPDRPARHRATDHLPTGWKAAHFVLGWHWRRRQSPSDGLHVRDRW